MEKDRVKHIHDRIKTLKIELTHECYLDGYTILKYKEELRDLIIELEKIKND